MNSNGNMIQYCLSIWKKLFVGVPGKFVTSSHIMDNQIKCIWNYMYIILDREYDCNIYKKIKWSQDFFWKVYSVSLDCLFFKSMYHCST